MNKRKSHDWLETFEKESVLEGRKVKEETWLSESPQNMFSDVKPSQQNRVNKSEQNTLYKDEEMLKKRVKRETVILKQETYGSYVSFVEQSSIWDGTVVEILEESFRAVLSERTGTHKRRIVEVKKSKINSKDWNRFFHVGFEFEWVFQKANYNGTIKNRNEIRFSPTVNYLKSEIDRMVEQEMKRFAYLFDEND